MRIILATLNAKYIHTSLAIRLLKAYSEHEFEDILLAEYTIKDPVMNIVSDLFQKQPDVIGFSCYIWNIEETVKLVSILKQVMPEVKIVLGGPEVSYEPLYWMKREAGIDFVVNGDGEETFHHLLQEIRDEHKYHFVYGAAYRKGEDLIVNPPRPKSDLNTLPTPHRFAEDLPELSKRIVYFETSRGCPFNCQFCLSSIEVGVRYYDIERVKSDLLYLIEGGAKVIKFLDRTFNINRNYAMEMFQFLIDNHQGCVFQFEITADIMRPEVLDFLAQNAPPGVFRFEIGVQSTNDETNELVKRRQNFTKLSRTVMKIKASGNIDQHLDLIAGLPMEDYSTFRKTFNDVFAMEPEELQLGFLKMLRGTGLRAQAAKYDYTYMEHAPYEILSSHVMPFSDIIRLKRLEDVLEKYWNSQRLAHSVKYLIRHVFPSPFDFFQEFGDYWEARGWQKIGHQLEDLFTRLHNFLTDRGTASMDIITGLMKLDYFLGHKYKPRKIWWDEVMGKSEWAKYLKQIAGQPELISPKLAEAGLSERELQKYIVLDVLPFVLAPVLDSISGLRFDGLAGAEGEAAENATVAVAGYEGSDKVEGGMSGSLTTAGTAATVAPAALLQAAVAVAGDTVPAVADAHPGSSGGSTLLIVLYQQDESQRAQYYALPI